MIGHGVFRVQTVSTRFTSRAPLFLTLLEGAGFVFAVFVVLYDLSILPNGSVDSQYFEAFINTSSIFSPHQSSLFVFTTPRFCSMLSILNFPGLVYQVAPVSHRQPACWET